MNKYDVNSDKFTHFIKEKELRSNFIFQEENHHEKEVSACLLRSELKIFCNNLLLAATCVDKSFNIESENLGKYEIRIRCVENDEILRFRLVSRNLDQFLLWKQALQVSKRPEDVDLPNCYLCSKRFGLFRRKYHCKSCGNTMCSKCCPYQAVVGYLGYVKKQNVCRDCVNELRSGTGITHQSLVMNKKVVDTRSVLE